MSLGLWLTLLLSVVLETQTIDDSTLALAVRSCDQVLPEHCSAAPGAAVYHVLLRADPALSEVQIEVHRGTRDGPLSASRTLALDLSAAREERARTLGLVIAAQVMAQTTPPPELPRARVEPPTTRRQRELTLDLAALAGTALDRGAPRLGGLLRVSWRASHFGVVGSLRGAARPGDDPRLWWLDLGAGALAHQRWGRLALEGRLELLAQRLQARAQDPGRREGASALRLGAQLGAELHLRVGGPNWLFAGAEAALLGPAVSLRLRGRAQGTSPVAGWGALIGYRRAW